MDWPERAATPSPSSRLAGRDAPAVGRPRAVWRRVVLFAVGDAALLVVVALAGTWVMHRSHGSGLGVLAATLLGMGVATLVQIGLATLVAPLLGSIESMVPSAVIGMTAPLLVCLLIVLGLPWHARALYVAAAGVALAFSLWLQIYAWRCRRRFARSPARAGLAGDARGQRARVDDAPNRTGRTTSEPRWDGAASHGR